MLRTIELILGIAPMSQYDAAATPMWRCFSSSSDSTAFESLPANIDLTEKILYLMNCQKNLPDLILA